MSRNLIGILFCIVLVFSLTEIRGKALQKAVTEIAAQEEYADCTNNDRQVLSKIENTDFITNDCSSSFDAFNYNFCDFTISAPVTSPRGVNYPKNLKFTSLFHTLSSQKTPLFTKNTQKRYGQYCVVESSCKYYVYTLRRILI